MNCEQVARDAVVEKYLLAQLSEAEQEAFELHYFQCVACFEELATRRQLQEELARPRAATQAEPAGRPGLTWRWAWAPVAAAAALVILTVWIRHTPVAVTPTQTPTVSSTPSAQPQPQAVSPDRALFIAELARIQPPRYSPVILRGAEDEATRRFHEAMQHYQRGKPEQAIPGLRSATQLNANEAEIHFFLGICYLLTGRTEPGIKALRNTVALGESPYLEQAHFYLAKAYLQKGNVAEASKELQTTVRLHGDMENQAGELVQKLEAGGKKSDKENKK
jgi:tetratricopeptide (TPR) repeat protein